MLPRFLKLQIIIILLVAKKSLLFEDVPVSNNAYNGNEKPDADSNKTKCAASTCTTNKNNAATSNEKHATSTKSKCAASTNRTRRGATITTKSKNTVNNRSSAASTNKTRCADASAATLNNVVSTKKPADAASCQKKKSRNGCFISWTPSPSPSPHPKRLGQWMSDWKHLRMMV